MARTVEAILKANVSGFNSSVDSATAKMNQLADAAQKAGARVDASLSKGASSAGKFGSTTAAGGAAAAVGLDKATTATGRFAKAGAGIAKNEAHLNSLSRTAAIAGTAIFAGIGLAVKATADFDQAMSHVSATGQEYTANLGALRKSALDAGAATAFSATEAAQAQEELAKAGVRATDILGGGLSGALDLAAAGTLGVADAAGIAATAMTQFGLTGADVPHIADLLAAGAGKAQGSVQDLGNALNYVGPVAASMGVSIEQTTGALAEFASAGIVGEQGGTALRGVLLSLTSPSQIAAKTMREYGISLYDAQGAFVGINGAAQQLKDGLGGLSEAERNAALGRIFGNAQITAATVLYNGGAAAVDAWTKKVNDSGFAARTAATKMDNLRGDVEKLGGSLQTAFIQTGEGATGGLRGLVKAADSAVGGFNELSSSSKGTVLAVGAIAGAGLLAGAGVLRLAVGLNSGRTAMRELATDSPRLAKGLGMIGKAAGIASAALIGLQVAGAIQRQFKSNFTPAVEEANKAVTELGTNPNANLDNLFKFESGVVIKDKVDGLGAAFQRISQNRFGDQLAEQVDRLSGTTDSVTGKIKLQFASLDQSLISLTSSGHADQAADGFRKIADAAALQGVPIEKVTALFPQYAASVRAAAESSKYTFKSTQELADAMGGKLSPALEKAMKAAGVLPAAFKANANAASDFGTAMTVLNGPLQRTVEQSGQLAQSLFQEGNAFQATQGSHSAYAQSLDDADKALGRHSLSISKDTGLLSDNTAKQREGVTAINNIATSGKAYVQSLVAQGASAKEAGAATAAVRSQFIAAADAAGLTAGQARKLADSYGLVPKEVTTTFQAFGLALQAAQVKSYGERIMALPKSQQSKIMSIYNDKGAKAALAYLNKIDRTKSTAKVKGDTRDATSKMSKLDRLKLAVKTARAKGDTRAADSAMRALNAYKIKVKTAVAKANTASAVAGIKRVDGMRISPKNVRVTESGAAVVQGRINGIRGKTVTVIVRQKSVKVGGITASAQKDGGPVTLADGGPVRGVGGKREDNIAGVDRYTKMQTSEVSVGEFVQPADSVDYYGLQGMQAVQEKRIPRAVLRAFADGGYLNPGPMPRLAVGGVAGPAQATFYGRAAYQLPLGVLNTLLAKVRALNNPLASLAGLVRQVRAATAGVVAAQKNLAAVRRKAGHTAAQVTAATDRLKTAQDKLVTSNENLGTAQASLADAIRSTSSTLRDAAATTSTDPADVLAKRKETAAGLEAFNKQLLALRKAGLNDQDLSDIVGRGQLDGADLAAQILKGGKGMVAALNLAQKQLTEAADKVGTTTNVGVIRRAGGGWIDEGPQGVDRVPTLTTRGEFVTNPRSATANAELLERINASQGRNIMRGMQGFVSGMSGGSSIVNRNIAIPVHIGQMGANTDQVAAKIQGRFMDALTMTGLAGVAS